MALSLEQADIFSLLDLSKQISCMLEHFCDSFSCNSMPSSGCPALHGVNPSFKKIKIKIFTSSIMKKNISVTTVLGNGYFD